MIDELVEQVGAGFWSTLDTALDILLPLLGDGKSMGECGVCGASLSTSATAVEVPPEVLSDLGGEQRAGGIAAALASSTKPPLSPLSPERLSRTCSV